MKKRHICFALFSSLTLSFPLVSTAQTLPDDASQLQRQELQNRQLRQRNEISPDVRLQVESKENVARLPDETPCFPIQSIRFSSDELPTEILQRALNQTSMVVPENDPALGRCLGAKGIQLLLDRVQNALVAQGYITSRVIVKDQSLNQGELQFTLVTGKIGEIRGKDEQRIPRANSYAMSTRQTLNLRDIEQTLENLRRLPNSEANIEIVPSHTEGQSDILIQYKQSSPLRLTLSVDDNGNKSTGKIQGNATLSWINPLGAADLFYFSTGKALADQEIGERGNRSYMLHYSIPVGYWLVSATTSRYQYHQTVFGAFENYMYRGESSNTELQVSKNIQRNQNGKTNAFLSTFAKQSHNYIDDTEVQVQQRRTAGWETGVQHQHYFSTATASGQIKYRQGTGAFGAMPAPEEFLGEGTSRMRLVLANFQIEYPFNWLGLNFHYSGQINWQTNRTVLSPQDRFCIGGRYTVRGFDGIQSLCADSGHLWRNELSLPIAAYPIRLFAGVDTGKVSGPNSDMLPGKELSGMVLGLRGNLPFISKERLQFEVFMGTPLHKPTQLETANQTSGFSFISYF